MKLMTNTFLNSVADLGMAVGSILLTPGDYSDKTICLNGPLTDCETASEAFSSALGKTVIYEQATYESYKQVRHAIMTYACDSTYPHPQESPLTSNFSKRILQTLLEAHMPEWQVLGILELFRMYERQESFCRGSTQVRHVL
jgi:hypothetical protein